MKGLNQFVYASVFLLVSLVLIGSSTVTRRLAEAPSPADISLPDGQEVYLTRCNSCHMANGEGVQGVFPPLANSEYVTGDKGRLVRMLLNGLRGEIVVNEVTYNGMMPPWGGFLSDQEIADVSTYIRTNFGNDAEPVTAEEVAKVRAAVADRKDAWTIDELNKPENLGIPDGE